MSKNRASVFAVAVLLLVFAITAQALLDPREASIKSRSETQTGISLSSVFDFLGGVRTYIAYRLIILIDDIHHIYGGALSEEVDIIPYYVLISWLEPHLIDAYYVGAYIAFQNEREQEGIEFTLQGIERNPDSAMLYQSLADLYMRQEKWDLAAQAVETAMKLENDASRVNLYGRGLAGCYEMMGEKEKALETYMYLIGRINIQLITIDMDAANFDFWVNTVNSYAEEAHRLSGEIYSVQH